jgi:hypothetical protein
VRGGGHGVYDLHIVDDSVWDSAIEHKHLGPVVSMEKKIQSTITWVACECVRTLDTDDNDMGGI